jgi:hypothetical protein
VGEATGTVLVVEISVELVVSRRVVVVVLGLAVVVVVEDRVVGVELGSAVVAVERTFTTPDIP